MPAEQQPSVAPETGSGRIHRIEELRSIVGQDGVQALIAAFTAELPVLMERLRAAIAEGKAGEIDLVLHTIKGAAANLGMTELAETAQSLRDVPAEKINIERILHVCDRTTGALGQQAA